MNQNVGTVKKLIQSSERIAIFTGAGISTESGIPNFRSPNGIWAKMKPIEFHDFVDSAEARRESWRRKIVIDRDINQASPNCGHRAVAALVRLGLCQTVITENIDGLHQVSDPSDDNVVELHGNGTYASCLTCGRRHELEPIYIAFARDESLPVCDHK